MDVGRGRGVLQGLGEVLALEGGVLGEDLVEGPVGGDEADDGPDRDAQAAESGPSLQQVGGGGDPVEGHDADDR